ncbi:thioredoxin [Mucilaginibacter hurinus]|uniref:Thioredoxin n=1 Tax=Mucilaginibacter hurinus TaxID=2201324 RepID=A0A367GRT0_9SPHI|nr:thioredoxin family protein [Mucilaginibacter hurinus]RCH55536.1 thioredoxin [Mucilaginibacter hurinus]
MITLIHNNISRVILLLLFVIPVSCQSQSKGGINFIENSWGEALKQAKKQNKYIFVDAYAVWCGPCKMLKRITFKDKDASEFYNKNFINVAMDMERGDGPILGSQWQITAYPTLLIFDPQGNLVSSSRGFIPSGTLIRFGKSALSNRKKI